LFSDGTSGVHVADVTMESDRLAILVDEKNGASGALDLQAFEDIL